MNRAVIIIALTVAVSAGHSAPLQQRSQRPQGLQPGGRPNAPVRPFVRRTLLEEAIFSFYVKQFQQEGEVSPEVFAKILPFVEQFLQERFEIGERRTRALTQVRLAIARNASDDEFQQLVRELDAADSEFLANYEKFLNNVDPLLTPRQQAKVRILQNLADNRIRQMIDALQNPNTQRRANPPAPRN